MKYLITGGCGFLGSNISSKILEQGDKLIVFDNLLRFGSSKNKEWLESQGELEFIFGDIRNANDVEKTIKEHKPDFIYHLAAQVAMTTSIKDPVADFEINVQGSVNLLNAVRLYSPGSTIIYSSTNKVYGDLTHYSYEELATRYNCIDKPNGFSEETKLDFVTPYGVSKGSSDQYMLDFAKIYGLKVIVFRHSSIYGERQFSTSDQGWLGWFTEKAIDIKTNISNAPFTISGNGKQVRDLLYVSDCVDLYLKASQKIDSIKGQVFNIGGGMQNSFSILEFFSFLENELDIKMAYSQLPQRISDQKVFVADIAKAEDLIDWKPKVSLEKGIKKLIKWVENIKD